MRTLANWWPVFAVFSPSLLVLGLIARGVICEGIKFMRSRGEESGVPEDSEYEEPVPVQTRQEIRDALDYVLANDAETCRRLKEMLPGLPELSEMPRRLEGLYVIEVEQ